MVSAGTDGEAEPLGDADGEVEGDATGEPEGDADGDGGIDGVASDGPGSTDGASVGGTLGTWPSPPDDVHADATTRRPARDGMRKR